MLNGAPEQPRGPDPFPNRWIGDGCPARPRLGAPAAGPLQQNDRFAGVGGYRKIILLRQRLCSESAEGMELKVLVSLIVPVHNETGSIAPFLARARPVLDEVVGRFG